VSPTYRNHGVQHEPDSHRAGGAVSRAKRGTVAP